MAPDIDAQADDASGRELQDTSGAVAAAQLVSYLVTAYRWGCTNEHAYHVYAGVDRTKALSLARAENADRGGKYGVVVWQFDADGTDYKPIAYFASTPEPDSAVMPHHNHRIDYFERLGQFLHEAESGKALLPDPAHPNRLIYQDVTPLPEYLRAEIERQRAFLTIWAGFDAKHRETKDAH